MAGYEMPVDLCRRCRRVRFGAIDVEAGVNGSRLPAQLDRAGQRSRPELLYAGEDFPIFVVGRVGVGLKLRQVRPGNDREREPQLLVVGADVRAAREANPPIVGFFLLDPFTRGHQRPLLGVGIGVFHYAGDAQGVGLAFEDPQTYVRVFRFVVVHIRHLPAVVYADVVV